MAQNGECAQKCVAFLGNVMDRNCHQQKHKYNKPSNMGI